jgi:hypothetical protein
MSNPTFDIITSPGIYNMPGLVYQIDVIGGGGAGSTFGNSNGGGGGPVFIFHM